MVKIDSPIFFKTLDQRLFVGDGISFSRGADSLLERAEVKAIEYFPNADLLFISAILDQPIAEDITNLDNQAGKD